MEKRKKKSTTMETRASKKRRFLDNLPHISGRVLVAHVVPLLDRKDCRVLALVFGNDLKRAMERQSPWSTVERLDVRKEILQIAVSNDGHWIACVCRGGSVRIYYHQSPRRACAASDDPQRQPEYITPQIHRTKKVLFSPTNPDLLATIAFNGTTRLWDLKKAFQKTRYPTCVLLGQQRRLSLLPFRQYLPPRIVFSPDGTTLAGTCSHRRFPYETFTSVWSVKDGICLQNWTAFPAPYGLKHIGFRPDGNGTYRVAFYWLENVNQIHIWEIGLSNNRRNNNNNNNISRTQQVEAVRSQVLLQQPPTDQHLFMFDLLDSNNGPTMASGHGCEAYRLWSLLDGSVILNFPIVPGIFHSFALSPDGTILAAIHCEGPTRISLYGVNDGSCLTLIPSGDSPRRRRRAESSVAFLPNGKSVVSSTETGMQLQFFDFRH